MTAWCSGGSATGGGLRSRAGSPPGRWVVRVGPGDWRSATVLLAPGLRLATRPAVRMASAGASGAAGPHG